MKEREEKINTAFPRCNHFLLLYQTTNYMILYWLALAVSSLTKHPEYDFGLDHTIKDHQPFSFMYMQPFNITTASHCVHNINYYYCYSAILTTHNFFSRKVYSGCLSFSPYCLLISKITVIESIIKNVHSTVKIENYAG